METFLTYNFKKPNYEDSQELPNLQPINDLIDIPHPLPQQTVVIEDEPQEIKEITLPKINVVKPSMTGKKYKMSDFKKHLMPDALRVAQKLKVDPNVILAQAFLESGGDTSKTIFGIKAQPGYKGKSEMYNTKEHLGGKYVDTKEAFRKYNTVAESFDDYANLILGNRYSAAVGKSPKEFYEILKNKGYATDPNYSSKLMNVYNQMSKS